MYSTKLSQAQRYASAFTRQLLDSNTKFAFQTESELLTEVTLSTDSSADKSIKGFESGKMTLVVSAEALNLEKLWQVQTALNEQLSVKHWQLKQSRSASINMIARAEVNLGDGVNINSHIESLALQYQLEIALLQEVPQLSQPGLLVMDMDSTVIAIECIDEIAKLAGVGEQVSEVTELAMQGKLDFAQSLTQRVACLAESDEANLQIVRQALPLMPGIESLIAVLKQNGWKVAIASGGFTYFANYLKERLTLDAAVSNTLEILDGKLTGKVLGGIVDAQVKAQTVESLAQEFNIPMQQTVAMGDGANDLVMMDKAALGVAYKAKPVVREKAQTAIRFGGLDQMLEYLK